MKAFFVLCLAAMTLAKPKGLPKIGFRDVGKSKIIGGHEAEPHAYPWQVSFRQLGQHICGGSIINERQVICAAHCVDGQIALFDSVVAGAHRLNLESGHQKRNIEKMEANDNFDFQQLQDDISIITVTQPFEFNDNVQPVEMYKASTDEAVAPGTTCISTGWGLTTGGGLFPPQALQEVSIDILSFDECNDIFQGYITEGMICAGKPGAGPCNGDSGGPLVCPDAEGKLKLAGIVSFGENGCTNAGVYTRVSQYEQWISDRIVA